MIARSSPIPPPTSSYLLPLLQRVPDIGSSGQRQHGHRDPGAPPGCEERRHLGKRNGGGGGGGGVEGGGGHYEELWDGGGDNNGFKYPVADSVSGRGRGVTDMDLESKHQAWV